MKRLTMIVRLSILFFVFSLISCKPKDHFDLELVSYKWSMKPEIRQDSLIPYVNCILYAQIKRNGECILTKTKYSDRDIHVKFTIGKEVLEPVIKIVESLNSDTIMTIKSNDAIYDGPTVKLIGLNNKGHSHNVKFDCSERTNAELLTFYNDIDSFSENSTTIATDSFMKAKENRIKEIYDSEIKFVPILKDEEVSEENLINQ
jgi:hypothetical protein